jgi:hypothetical protein
MTLEEAIKIKDSLLELSPSVEDFSWGPSWEFAQKRRKEALKIIRSEIKRIQNEQISENSSARKRNSAKEKRTKATS